jgi:hypothetical protein
MYCRGSARDRLLQSVKRRFLEARGQGSLDDSTCSRSQRNSLIAESRVRVPRRTRGRIGEILKARRRRECGSRGMSLPWRKSLQ